MFYSNSSSSTGFRGSSIPLNPSNIPSNSSNIPSKQSNIPSKPSKPSNIPSNSSIFAASSAAQNAPRPPVSSSQSPRESLQSPRNRRHHLFSQPDPFDIFKRFFGTCDFHQAASMRYSRGSPSILATRRVSPFWTTLPPRSRFPRLATRRKIRRAKNWSSQSSIRQSRVRFIVPWKNCVPSIGIRS